MVVLLDSPLVTSVHFSKPKIQDTGFQQRLPSTFTASPGQYLDVDVDTFLDWTEEMRDPVQRRNVCRAAAA